MRGSVSRTCEDDLGTPVRRSGAGRGWCWCSAVDGPEAFPDLPAALVSGRHLTWYGPSLVEAREVLERQLGQAFSATTSR